MNDDRDREQICRSAAASIRQRGSGLSTTHALIGFDGFVDEIIAVVDHRYDLHHYERVETITRMAEKILNAAGKSSNYELMVTRRKLGGNGPIMANALATLGMTVTYIGSLGVPELDPVFHDFATRAEVISIANPGFTNALEFADGKLMLSKLESLHDVDWDHLTARLPIADLIARFEQTRLIGLLNWTELPGLPAIWDHLLTDVFPHLTRTDRILFIDLVDPEKRTVADIRAALATLTRFQEQVDVVLGLNLKEATQVASALGLPVPGDSLEASAQAIRSALGLTAVVIHPREGAVAATATATASILGPFVAHPIISTGAGDHFNTGFCMGWVLAMPLAECLAAGVATSGHYVRTAQSPTTPELADFLDCLPTPES